MKKECEILFDFRKTRYLDPGSRVSLLAILAANLPPK